MSSMVKIIADSISPQNIRITTFHLRYWRAIHAELMTHRDFSRNARSSRAVPSMTLINEPTFIPTFGMNQPGMQSKINAPPELQARWAQEWSDLADICRMNVTKWTGEGMHKQHANRPLEWFGYIDVLVTSTKGGNFWALRISEYAQPEFNDLAQLMQHEMQYHKPKRLKMDEWHLPYISDEELAYHGIDVCLRLSTARCARLSYKPFDGNDSLEAEYDRYRKLVVSQPVHASPAEHQATPDQFVSHKGRTGGFWRAPETHGNLWGWTQHRKLIPYEAVRETLTW